MQQQNDDAALLDVAKAARLIIEFSRDLDEAGFQADIKTQSAVLHQLLVLGEAVKRLSPEFRASHPNMPWSDMAGMRDILIHQYDTVDLIEVWSTATQDVPALLSQLVPLLPTDS